MNDIIMPQFGETVDEEIIISKWFKSVGDTVAEGETLMEIETGKSVLSVESAFSGVLWEIVVPEGGETRPLQVVGKISE